MHPSTVLSYPPPIHWYDIAMLGCTESSWVRSVISDACRAAAAAVEWQLGQLLVTSSFAGEVSSWASFKAFMCSASMARASGSTPSGVIISHTANPDALASTPLSITAFHLGQACAPTAALPSTISIQLELSYSPNARMLREHFPDRFATAACRTPIWLSSSNFGCITWFLGWPWHVPLTLADPICRKNNNPSSQPPTLPSTPWILNLTGGDLQFLEGTGLIHKTISRKWQNGHASARNQCKTT